MVATPAEFQGFPSIRRLYRRCVITEKLDGTNAQVLVSDDGDVRAGSRNRFLTVEADNFGFASWVAANADALRLMGPGRHFGEWWGAGIQRRYGLADKRFSLFHANRVLEVPPCVSVVPVLYDGVFSTEAVRDVMASLEATGSVAAPGFMKPEGVVVWHDVAKVLFKVTFEHDQTGKLE